MESKLKSNSGSISVKYNKPSLKKGIMKYKYFYLLILPVLTMLVIFKYIPMLGIRFAFAKYGPFAPPKYIGFDNFKALFKDPRFLSAFYNTLFLSLANLLLATVLTIIVALLVNELRNKYFKSFTQTLIFLPHFVSLVVAAAIFTLILSPQSGIINQILGLFGIKPIYFLTSSKWWPSIFLIMNRWKETGWGTVIYLAALSGINPELYEAAAMDGASRLKQAWHVTLPGIANTILVVIVLDLAKVLNLFQPVFVLQNPTVYDVGDVIQTYVYRKGLIQSNYGYSIAVGLFVSVVSLILVLSSNAISKKIRGRGII